MDILSHGLYGGIAFGRQSKLSYGKSFFFGIMPDLFSFGILFFLATLSFISGPDWSEGTPDPSTIPNYVHRLYDVTHSFIIAGIVIGLVRFYYGKPMIELWAWPLHILVDIPTHSSEFFPTPFLWPLSEATVDGVSWSTPFIFLSNIAILIALYLGFYLMKKYPESDEEHDTRSSV